MRTEEEIKGRLEELKEQSAQIHRSIEHSSNIEEQIVLRNQQASTLARMSEIRWVLGIAQVKVAGAR